MEPQDDPLQNALERLLNASTPVKAAPGRLTKPEEVVERELAALRRQASTLFKGLAERRGLLAELRGVLEQAPLERARPEFTAVARDFRASIENFERAYHERVEELRRQRDTGSEFLLRALKRCVELRDLERELQREEERLLLALAGRSPAGFPSEAPGPEEQIISLLRRLADSQAQSKPQDEGGPRAAPPQPPRQSGFGNAWGELREALAETMRTAESSLRELQERAKRREAERRAAQSRLEQELKAEKRLRADTQAQAEALRAEAIIAAELQERAKRREAQDRAAQSRLEQELEAERRLRADMQAQAEALRAEARPAAERSQGEALANQAEREQALHLAEKLESELAQARQDFERDRSQLRAQLEAERAARKLVDEEREAAPAPLKISRLRRAAPWSAAAAAALATALAWLPGRSGETLRPLPLERPAGLAAGPQGLYALDSGRKTLALLSTEGEPVRALKPLAGDDLRGVAIGADTVWTADPARGRILQTRLSDTGEIDKVFREPGSRPTALHWDGAHLWVADTQSRTVQKLTVAETLGLVTEYPMTAAQPVGLHRSQDLLWILDGASRVLRRYRLGETLSAVDQWDLSQKIPPSAGLAGFAVQGEEVWFLTDNPPALRGYGAPAWRPAER